MDESAATPTPTPEPEDPRATLRVKNPDVPAAAYAAKVLKATTGDHDKLVRHLRGVMAESLFRDKVVQLLSRGDNVAWGASMMAAAIDYLMGMGLTHNELQQLVTTLWEGNRDKVHEFNALAAEAEAKGEDLDDAVDRACRAKTKAAETEVAEAVERLLGDLAKMLALPSPAIDPDFKTTMLPHQRTGGKPTVH